MANIINKEQAALINLDAALDVTVNRKESYSYSPITDEQVKRALTIFVLNPVIKEGQTDQELFYSQMRLVLEDFQEFIKQNTKEQTEDWRLSYA